jgi:cation transport ATPase
LGITLIHAVEQTVIMKQYTNHYRRRSEQDRAHTRWSSEREANNDTEKLYPSSSLSMEDIKIDTELHEITVLYKPDQTGPRDLIEVIESAISGVVTASIICRSRMKGASQVRGNQAIQSLVQFVIGCKFYTQGNIPWLTKHGCPYCSRDEHGLLLLSLLSSSSSYLWGLYVNWIFFLISFILLGKYLEILAKGKTSEAIAKLMDNQKLQHCWCMTMN